MATTERVDIIVNERGARVVKRRFDEIAGAARGTNLAVRLASRAMGAVAAALSIQKLIQYADTYTNLQNRLRQVTTGTENLAGVTQNLFDIANRTRSSYEGTAELYARLALATKEMGYAQQDLLTFTQRVNEAIVLSGASSQEASAGLIQLSQGLASGTLRGDELRSVLEQLPAVADVIAEHLGVTRGELRKLGEQGKIVTEDIVAAFLAAENVTARFGSTVPTLGQAWTVAENRLIQFIGQLDKATGATNTLAQAIIDLSSYVDFSRLTAAMAGARAYMQTIWQDFPKWFGEIFDKAVFNALNALSKIGTKLTEDTLRDARQGQKILDFFGIPTPEYAKKAIKDLEGEVGKDLAKMYDWELPPDAVARQSKNGSDAAQAYIDAYQLALLDMDTSGALNGAKDGSGRTPPVDPKAIKKLQGELRTLLDSIDPVAAAERQWADAQTTLGRALSAGMINLDQYNAYLTQTAQSLDAVRFPVQDFLWNLEQQSMALGLEAQQRERVAQILQLEETMRRKLTDTERQWVDNALKGIQARQREADLYDEIVGPLDSYRNKLAALAAIQGRLTGDQYAQKLREINIEYLELGRTVEDGLARGVLKLQDQFTDLASVAESAITNAFSNMEDALVQFVTTGKLEVSDLVNSIIADLARIAIRESITGPLANALGGILGSVLGGLGGGASVSMVGSVGSGMSASSWMSGRAYGGPTAADAAYRVNERGVPEVWSSGTEDYLLTGAKSGRVTPLGDTSAPVIYVQPKVNVYNNAGANVEVQQRQGSDGQPEIDVLIDQISTSMAAGIKSGQNPMVGAISDKFGLAPQPGGR